MAMYSIVLVLIFIITAVILVAFYKTLYTRNMNKALQGEGTAGLFDPGQFILVVALIVIAITGFVNMSKINDLRTQILNNNYQISNLNQIVHNQSGSIHDLEELIEEYYQSQELVQNIETTLAGYSNDMYQYSVEFDLLELSTGSEVSLLVIDNDNISDSYSLESTSLSFVKVIDLEEDKTYDVYVYISGTKAIQRQIATIDVEHDLNRIYDITYYPEEDELDEYPSSWILQLRNNNPSASDLLIDQVEVKVYVNDVLTETIVETEQAFLNDVLQVFETQLDYQLERSHDDTTEIKLVITITDLSGNTHIFNENFS